MFIMVLLSEVAHRSVLSVERDFELKKRTRWLGWLFFLSTVFVVRPAFAKEYISDEWMFSEAPHLWSLELDGVFLISNHCRGKN
jgi:hypothetical protein